MNMLPNISASSAVDLSLIRTDGGTQSRAQLYSQVVAEYIDALAGGASFPPVVVFFDGTEYWLADGFHRHAAHAGIGLAEIAAEVRQGTRRDAILYSVGANSSHGLRRTNDDKRRAVMVLLNDAEWAGWSNREIARLCSVSPGMVDGLRQSLPNLGSDTPRTFTDRWGNTSQMNTGNIGATPAPEKQRTSPGFESYERGDESPVSPIDEAPTFPVKKTMDPTALWVWGRLNDFERQGVLSKSPRVLASEMTEPMRADVRRLLPLVRDFLNSMETDI